MTNPTQGSRFRSTEHRYICPNYVVVEIYTEQTFTANVTLAFTGSPSTQYYTRGTGALSATKGSVTKSENYSLPPSAQDPPVPPLPWFDALTDSQGKFKVELNVATKKPFRLDYGIWRGGDTVSQIVKSSVGGNNATFAGWMNGVSFIVDPPTGTIPGNNLAPETSGPYNY